MTVIKNKTAFVTGAASGIGLALTKALLAEGANVMMADVNADTLVEALKAAKAIKHEGKVAVVVCDVSDPASVKAAANATAEKFGNIHLVFNNAGVALSGVSGDIAIEDWRWIVDINLMGVVYGVETFLPMIKAHGEAGHIINTASMAGHLATGYMAPYHATKFAVVGYSEGLHEELKSSNIGVSVLCPTWVKSNIYNTQNKRPTATEAELETVDQNPVYQATKALVDNGMTAETYAGRVLKSVKANRFYVFNDPEVRDAIDVRRDAILADYDACLTDLEDVSG